MTRIHKDWCKRIDSRTMTYGSIRQFCNGIIGDGGHRTALTATEKADLLDRARAVWNDGGFDLIGSWQGRDWKPAANEWMARNGRRLARSIGFAPVPDAIIHAAVDGTLDFRWVGVRCDGVGAYRLSVVPIYRAIAPDGTEFDYYARPWQAKAYA